VNVRVDSLGQLQGWVETMGFVTGEAWLSDLKTSLDKLDMAVLQSVVNNPLVLLDRDGACGVAKES